MGWFRLWAILFVILLLNSRNLHSQPLQKVSFQESNEIFPNPERGWYAFRDLSSNENYDIRAEGRTLIFGRILASNFKDKPFSQQFLNDIQAGFDLARQNGIKVNPRVAYNSGPEAGCASEYGCDATKDVVLNHINQLSSLWQSNMDVINVLDPGFIGGWGEWHTSSNGLDSPENMKEILFAILEALPKERMVYVRYPAVKREIFGGSKTSATPVLDQTKAFDQSYLARIGHLNDCFLSSETDVGTYQYGWTREQNLDYIGAESKFTPFGGESCAIHALGDCSNALLEMKKLHINHLNQDYHAGVVQGWRDGGCYDEISRRLGYRFVLRSVMLPSSIKPGGNLELQIEIENVGFGELFNPRDVEIVLSQGNSEYASAKLSLDPRYWQAGDTVNFTTILSLPISVPQGEYELGIRMPDKSSNLHDDARYAVRFGNSNIWNSILSTNRIISILSINNNASGLSNPNYSVFEEIGGNLSFRPNNLPFESSGIVISQGSSHIHIIPNQQKIEKLKLSVMQLNGELVYINTLSENLEISKNQIRKGLFIFNFIGSGNNFSTLVFIN